MKAYWINSSNVGDTLTPVIMEHFTDYKLERVNAETPGKLIAVGSTMTSLCKGDTAWGTGIMRETDTFHDVSDCRFLAVRGKLTEKILGVDVGVYGDPALLLPLMYGVYKTKTHRIGIIPHYAEKDESVFSELSKQEGSKIIDVNYNWELFIDEIVSCEEVISSSLHGIVIAEAYEIPATWIKPTAKVAGDGFKFKDYLTGTGREIQKPGKFPPISIPKLKEIQDGLLKSLKCL